MNSSGQLIVLGSGIKSISQLTLETAAWIEAADVVCYLLADPLTERWIHEHAREVEDLAALHSPGEARVHAYRAMSRRLVQHAQRGRLVVGVFYGHPGVFTSPSHWAVAGARAAGIRAQMLPAVSAEDCLFADLGIDPGDGACQSFEATDLLIRAREPAVDAHLIIWQVGVVAQTGLEVRGDHVGELVGYLTRFYPDDHVVTHYRAAQSVIADPVTEQVPLGELAALQLTVTSTLYVPPLLVRDYDMEMASAVDLVGSPPHDPADTDRTDESSTVDLSADEPVANTWYRAMATGPSRLAAFISALSTDPSLLHAVRTDPGPYLAAIGLDMIESWAFLSRNQEWINACIREGSGPAAAVSLGAAATEDEANEFFIHSDGRLVRRLTPATP